MDGLPQIPILETIRSDSVAWRQRTLKSAIDCVGIGVHTGQRVNLTLRPAEAGHGIVFRRTDLGRSIEARYDRVVDTRLSTVIADKDWASARVGTIEHLMAALSATGVDNVLVEVDGPELPILDGSAAPYLFLIDCAGVVELTARRQVIEVSHPVRVSDGEAFVELQPLPGLSRSTGPVLELELSIDFDAGAIGQQSCRLTLSDSSFRRDVARARTFALAHEIEQLRANGFAQGGSLDNAVVVEGDKVLNPGGLRMENEFARHKMLDAIGDLALAGAALHGRFIGNRPGHALNNRLLRALFAAMNAKQPEEAAPIEAVAA